MLVFQLCNQLGFFFKAADEVWSAGKIWKDDLDRNFAIDKLLLRSVNSTMSPLPDLLQ